MQLSTLNGTIEARDSVKQMPRPAKKRPTAVIRVYKDVADVIREYAGILQMDIADLLDTTLREYVESSRDIVAAHMEDRKKKILSRSLQSPGKPKRPQKP